MKWEYTVYRCYLDDPTGEVDMLDGFGLEGWELVTVAAHEPTILYYFKRPLITKTNPTDEITD